MVDGICVDPAQVSKIWPHVSGLIYIAMKRGGLGSFVEVEKELLAGRMLLWLVTEDKEIKAAVVTALEQTEWCKACTIVACGGRELNDWIGLLGKLEEYAKAEGCNAVRIYGREGWMGYLPETYRVHRVVIERAL